MWETRETARNVRTGRLVANLQTSGRPEFREVPDWLGSAEGANCRALELPDFVETASVELIDILELRAGLSVDSQGGFEVISEETATARFAALRQKLEADKIPSSTNRFIRWALENPRTQKVTPPDANSVPAIIETFVNSSLQTANKSSAYAVKEAHLVDPLHPLVHLAMANAESHPETARLWRIYGVKRWLLAPENEAFTARKRSPDIAAPASAF